MGEVRREHSSGFGFLFQWCFPQESEGVTDCSEEVGLGWKEAQPRAQASGRSTGTGGQLGVGRGQGQGRRGPPGFCCRLRAFAGVEARRMGTREAWKDRAALLSRVRVDPGFCSLQASWGIEGCIEPWSAVTCSGRHCCRFQGDWL